MFESKQFRSSDQANTGDQDVFVWMKTEKPRGDLVDTSVNQSAQHSSLTSPSLKRTYGGLTMGLLGALFCFSAVTPWANKGKKTTLQQPAAPAKAVAPDSSAQGVGVKKPESDQKKTQDAAKKPDMVVQAKQAYMIDLSTNTVLLEKNADQTMAPSSMTKILTVYMMLQAVAEKSLDWAEKIYISENAAKKPGSRMFIKPGESIAVLDLLKGIVVTSGNDACTAIAEFLGGSEEGFADQMNALAKKIGMHDSNFANASGLPADNHYSTCKDLAKIALKTLTDFPKEYGQFYKMTAFKFNGINQPNRNILLANGFADGMKTGMTDAGGYGIVASAKQSGVPERRLLLVLNGVKSATLRAAEARRLLNWGFQRFESLVVDRGKMIAQVPLWKEGAVSLVTGSSLALTLPKGSLRRAKIVAKYHQPLTAPIQKNQKLGVLTIEIPDQPRIEVPLVAQHDVRAPSLWDWILGLFQKKSIQGVVMQAVSAPQK